MEARGVEPLFPRCDRGVFPLHHAPDPAGAIVSLERWVTMKIPPDFALSVGDSVGAILGIVGWFFCELVLTEIDDISYKLFSEWIMQVPAWLSMY